MEKAKRSLLGVEIQTLIQGGDFVVLVEFLLTIKVGIVDTSSQDNI